MHREEKSISQLTQQRRNEGAHIGRVCSTLARQVLRPTQVLAVHPSHALFVRRALKLSAAKLMQKQSRVGPQVGVFLRVQSAASTELAVGNLHQLQAQNTPEH